MRRTIGSLVAVFVLLAVPGSALAASNPSPHSSSPTATSKHKPTKHTVTATAVAVALAQTGTPPQAGSTESFLEQVQSSPGGLGAAIIHLTFTGPTGAPGTSAYHGTRTVYFAQGSVSGTLKATLTTHPNGTTTYSGTETVTGGTVLYKGAKGTLKYTGASTSSSVPVTLHFTGTMTY